MTLVQRFTTINQGAMVLTGNAFYIYGQTAYPASGTDPWTPVAYMSTDTTKQLPGFPLGTVSTTNITQASSMAVLNIPKDSSILYASLMWCFGASTITEADKAISFTTPVRTTTITPTLSDSASGLFWRAADVKTLVQESMSGNYIFRPLANYTAIHGWFLIVVYKNDTLPFRYFNINTGISYVDNTNQATYNFVNFITPQTGNITGYLLMSYIGGDLVDKALLKIGTSAPGVQVGNPSTGTWNGQSPYNPQNNMFPSIICNADTNDPNIGLLDTRGSFGAYNMNPYNNTVPAFGRVLADIAGINISSNLTNNQSNVYTNVSFNGSGNAYISSESIQVDVNSVDIRNISKSVDKTYADIGDTLTYTISFTNTGRATAQNVIFIDTTPNGTEFVKDSLILNNIPQICANPNAPGLPIPDIAQGVSNTISFKIKIIDIPSPNPIKSKSYLGYNFTPAIGQQIINGNNSSLAVVTTINYAHLNIFKTTNKNYSTNNDQLTFTIVATNLGTVAAYNVVLKDTLPSRVSFIPNSLYINGIQSSNTLSSINIGTIEANSSSTVTFKVNVQ